MKGTKVLLLVAAAGAAVFFILRSTRQAAPQTIAAQQPLRPNTGAGGTLANLGAWFGAASQLVGFIDPNAVPADRSTPTANLASIANPVSSSPAILGYSYKQATVDVPSLLGTDDLFTPGDGSAGAYIESGVPGTGGGPTSTDYWA